MSVERIDYSLPDLGRALDRSLRETGFALLTGTPLTAAMIESLENRWLHFFESEDKHRFAAGDDLSQSQAGYISGARAETAIGASSADLKECFHHLPGAALPEALSASFTHFRNAALAIGRTLAQGLAPAGPQSVKKIEDGATWVSDAATLARVAYYPPLVTVPAGALRAAAHQDINLMTILPVASEPGLEIKLRDGSWQALHAEPGTLVVNAGDMLRELSGDHYPSTRHRVVNPGDAASNTARVSMPVFLTPNPDCVLSDRYTAGNYLSERLDAINQDGNG